MCLVKSIKALILVMLTSLSLINCDYGESYHCIDSPRQRYYLDSSAIKKADVVNKPILKLQYAKSGKVLDTIELLNVGSSKLVLKLLDYNYCDDDLKDYVEGLSFYFVGNTDKRHKLTMSLLPVHITYYSSRSADYPNYSLSSGQESIEVRWNNLETAIELKKLELTTAINFYPSIQLGSKTFSNLYVFPFNDSSYVYLNKSTLAQIGVGDETWTNIE